MKKKLEEKDLTSFYTHRHHIIDLTRILQKIIHASYQSTMFEKSLNKSKYLIYDINFIYTAFKVQKKNKYCNRGEGQRT